MSQTVDLDEYLILQNDLLSAPSSWILVWKRKQQQLTIFKQPHFTFFFFLNLHLLLLKRLKDFFFQSKLSGLWENRTFHKANFPWCSGNIITPKHHSFRMTFGFIYKKKTSLTPINYKIESQSSGLTRRLWPADLETDMKNKFDTIKCHVGVSVSIWAIIQQVKLNTDNVQLVEFILFHLFWNYNLNIRLRSNSDINIL